MFLPVKDKDEANLSSSPDWLSRSRVSRSHNSPNIAHNTIIGFNLDNNSLIPPERARSRSNSPEIPIDYTRMFFQPVLVGSEELRKTAIENILETLNHSLKLSNQLDLSLIRAHIGMIVRLSTECPFPDVREAFSQFIHQLTEEKLGINIPSASGFSSFVSVSENSLAHLLQDKNFGSEMVARLCELAFLQQGSVGHLVQLLAWHPLYLEKFFQTYEFLMYDTGPLLPDWRSYIAVIASSVHSCSYLVDSQEKEFLESDGDPAWLKGIQFSPNKIKALSKINAILAHQPWRLTTEHIFELCFHGGTGEVWSLGELIHAIIIIVSFHSLSSIVLGCGILAEVEDYQNHSQSNQLFDSANSTYDFETYKLFQALTGGGSDFYSNENEQKNVFDDIDNPESTNNHSSENHLTRTSSNEKFSKYLDYPLSYEDFKCTSKDYIFFHVSDFCWKDHAFPLVAEYYSDIAPLLDDQFKTIYNLTYRTLYNNEDVDTEKFRMAVWYYVHRVEGIFHDDYNYRTVNLFLNIKLKTFIKKLVCYPCEIKVDDFKDFGIDLTFEERVHIVLLAAEARKQAALLYGLRAVAKYQTELRARHRINTT